MMFLLYSDTYMPLLALLLYITIWRHAGVLDRVVFIYCVVNFILYGLTNVLADRGIHNSFLYHISSLVDLWLISYYILKKITQLCFNISNLLKYSCQYSTSSDLYKNHASAF